MKTNGNDIATLRASLDGTASRMNRRSFVRIGGAAVVTLASSPVPALASVLPEPTRIVFASGPDDTGTLGSLIDVFNRSQSDVEVVYREMARASDAHFRQLESEFLVNGEEIDVFSSDVVWTATFANNDWAEDLSRRFYNDYDPDLFLESALRSAAYRFRVWGVPWYTDAGMLFYRRDLLDAVGVDQPPRTWEELMRVAREVMRAHDIPYGFVFQGAEYEGGVANAMEFIWNAGGRVLTGNISVAGAFGQPVLDPNIVVADSAESARGLDMARALVAEGLAPRNVLRYREIETSQAFLAGEAVFMRNWPTASSIVTGPGKLATEQVGVAGMPRVAGRRDHFSCRGGWNLMINSRSAGRKKDAGWQFIRYLTAPEQQRIQMARGGFLPVFRSLYEDPEIESVMPVVGLAKNIIQSARNRPESPFYMQMSPRIAQAFHRTVRGDLTGAEAARRLQRELQIILRKNR